jgi:hypothetical protein
MGLMKKKSVHVIGLLVEVPLASWTRMKEIGPGF